MVFPDVVFALQCTVIRAQLATWASYYDAQVQVILGICYDVIKLPTGTLQPRHPASNLNTA